MNSGEDQSLRNLQEVADGILKKLFASGNQIPLLKMDKIHFKLTHEGVTRRFAIPRSDDNLINSLKGRVLEIVGAEDVELYWKDNESNIVLESVDDIDAAIDYAETKNKLGCITLEIGESVSKKKEQEKKVDEKTATASESKAAFNGFVFICDSCDCYLAPSNGGRFTCMVCDNYDLCAACHSKGTHSNHAFAHLMNGKTEIPFLLPSKGVMFMLAQQAPRCTPKFISSNDCDGDESRDEQILDHEKNDDLFEKIATRMRAHERSIGNFDEKDMIEYVKRLEEELKTKERKILDARSEFMQMNDQEEQDEFDAALLEERRDWMEREMKRSAISTGHSDENYKDNNEKKNDKFMRKKNAWEEDDDVESIDKPLIDIGGSSTTKRVVSPRIDSPSVATTDEAPSMEDMRRGGRRSSAPSILSDNSTIQPNRRKIENDDSDFGDDKSLDGYADRVDTRYETEDSMDSDDEPLVNDSYGYPARSAKIPEKEKKTAQTWISKPQDNLSYGAEMKRRREEKEENIRRMNEYDSENEKKPWKGRRNAGGFGKGEKKTENGLRKSGFGSSYREEEYRDGVFGGRDTGFGSDDRGFARSNRDYGSGVKGGFGEGEKINENGVRKGGFGSAYREDEGFGGRRDGGGGSRRGGGFGRDYQDNGDRRNGGFGSGRRGRGFGDDRRTDELVRNGGFEGFGRDDIGFNDKCDSEERGFGRWTEDRRNVTFGGDDVGKSEKDFGRKGYGFSDRKLKEEGRGGKSFGGTIQDYVKGRGNVEDERRGFGFSDGGFGRDRNDGGFGKRARERRNDGGFDDGGFGGSFERGENGRGNTDRGFGRSGGFEGRDLGFGNSFKVNSNRSGCRDVDIDRREKNDDFLSEMGAYMRASQMPAHLAILVIDEIKNLSSSEMQEMLEQYLRILRSNSYGLKRHPAVLCHPFQFNNEKYLIGNIIVDLHKHLTALNYPDRQPFRVRLLDTRGKIVNALKENGTNGPSYKEMAEKLHPILLTQRYTLNDEVHRDMSKEHVGFMVPDPLRDNAKPPRVACSETYFLFCDEHTHPNDFNANPSPRYRCPTVFPM